MIFDRPVCLQLRLATKVKQENSNLAAFTTSHQEKADSTRSNLASSTGKLNKSDGFLRKVDHALCNFLRYSMLNSG